PTESAAATMASLKTPVAGKILTSAARNGLVEALIAITSTLQHEKKNFVAMREAASKQAEYAAGMVTLGVGDINCLRRAAAEISDGMVAARVRGTSQISQNDHTNLGFSSLRQENQALSLRYGLVPLYLEPICDGCGKRADVEHYLSCPVGGLRNHRHVELGREFATTAKDALTPAYVGREPRIIRSGEQRQVRNANAVGSNSTSSQSRRREDRTRGDVSVYGFHDPLSVSLMSASLIPRSNPIGRKTP
ncbi:hypothetical protein THAOC_32440, partial [Thalassiosira oceanica]